MNLIFQWANYLSKPYLFIGDTPPQNSSTKLAKLRLRVSICLYKILYQIEKKNGALFFIGKCYQSLCDFENALAYFKKTWETDPFNPILFKEICTTCLKMKRFEEGLQYALKEVSQFPSAPESKANLAFFLYKNNRLEEAKKVIDEAYQMDNKNPYVKQIYEILKKID